MHQMYSKFDLATPNFVAISVIFQPNDGLLHLVYYTGIPMQFFNS